MWSFCILLCFLADLQWKAPELLRDIGHSLYGSQKGDIYSFALILYEIHGRKGPWGDIGLSAKGLLCLHEKPRYFNNSLCIFFFGVHDVKIYKS